MILFFKSNQISILHFYSEINTGEQVALLFSLTNGGLSHISLSIYWQRAPENHIRKKERYVS